MKHKVLATFSFLLGAIALTLIFNFSDPVSIGLWGVVGVFAIIYYLCFLLILAVALQLQKKRHAHQPKRPQFSIAKVRYISLALAAAPVFLLSGLSLGSVTVLEALIIALGEAVGLFLIVKKVA